jgi:hypothetical protein
VPEVAGVSAAVHPEPETVALTQLTGATVAEVANPTLIAVPAGDTVPASDSAIPAVPVVGGLLITTALPAATITAVEIACTDGIAVCSAHMKNVPAPDGLTDAVQPVPDTVAASGGSGLSYNLISGSGNGSLTGMTLSTTAIGSAPATDWSSSIAPAATDVAPNATVTTAKFWFDTTNTGVTLGTYGNALLSGNNLGFYANSDGFGTPTCAPAAPSSGGTYYGKYAFYNSSNMLLGVFSTSAITVT